jgi:hypothetical protein
MSKKHFIALADAIREHTTCGGQPFTEDQLNVLAGFCKRQNPAFDRSRWLGYIAGKNGPSGGAR